MKTLIAIVVLLGINASSLDAEEKPVTTLEAALEMPTSFSIEREPFIVVLQRLEKHVQTNLPKGSSVKFEIRMLAEDIKLEGFTQNLPVRDLKQRNQPVRNVLTAIVQKLPRSQNVKSPSDPGQVLVWVIGPDPDDAKKQVILITTRKKAEERSYNLPKEFVLKKEPR